MRKCKIVEASIGSTTKAADDAIYDLVDWSGSPKAIADKVCEALKVEDLTNVSSGKPIFISLLIRIDKHA